MIQSFRKLISKNILKLTKSSRYNTFLYCFIKLYYVITHVRFFIYTFVFGFKISIKYTTKVCACFCFLKDRKRSVLFSHRKENRCWSNKSLTTGKLHCSESRNKFICLLSFRFQHETNGLICIPQKHITTTSYLTNSLGQLPLTPEISSRSSTKGTRLNAR